MTMFFSQTLNTVLFWSLRNKHVCVAAAVITHADGSCVSIAIIRVCDSVILSVCPQYKAKTAKLKSPDLAQDSPSPYLANQLILSQKVKGQGLRVTKCKKRSSGGRRELNTLSRSQPLVLYCYCVSSFFSLLSIGCCYPRFLIQISLL